MYLIKLIALMCFDDIFFNKSLNEFFVLFDYYLFGDF